MEGRIFAIDKNSRFVVDGAKVQNDAVIAWPAGGHIEPSLEPAIDAVSARNAYIVVREASFWQIWNPFTGKSAFQTRGNEYGVLELLAEGWVSEGFAVRVLVSPDAIEILPRRSL